MGRSGVGTEDTTDDSIVLQEVLRRDLMLALAYGGAFVAVRIF